MPHDHDPTSSDTPLDGLRAAHRGALAPVTERMLALAALAPGQRVLDVGSGGGEMALLAAARVGSDGYVLATDASLAAMRPLLEQRAASPRPQRLEVRAWSAEELAPDGRPFDVALARNCVMYFRDRPRALANIRARLRAGGRFVASLYGPLEQEPFHAIPVAAVQRRRVLAEPLPQYAQAFLVSCEMVVTELEAAGFRGIEQHAVRTRRSYPSLQQAIAWLHHSPSLAELLSQLDAPGQTAAWAEIAAGFGSYAGPAGLELPGAQVVVLAVA